MLKMIQRKTSYNLLTIITTVYLFLYTFKGDLFKSNLSRIANENVCNYVLLIILCLLYGTLLYSSLKRQTFTKPYLVMAFISMLVGAIVPYDYLKVNSFNSNLHLGFAIISCMSTLLIEFISLYQFKIIKPKIGNYLMFGFIIVVGIGIYLYGKYMFVNGLNELILLTFVLTSQMIIFNEVKE